MNFEKIKEQIKPYMAEYLTMTRRPIDRNFHCVSGNHKDAKPSMSYYPQRCNVYCFACGARFDVIDLIGIDYGITDYGEKLGKACEIFNVPLNDPKTITKNNIGNSYSQQTENDKSNLKGENIMENRKMQIDLNKKVEPNYDFTATIEEAHKNLISEEHPNALKYFTKVRGLSIKMIEKYKLGFSKCYNDIVSDYENLKSKSLKQNLYNYTLPIWDADGKCKYFIAEISDRSKTDEYNAKYKNLHNTIPFQIFNDRYIVSLHNRLKLCFVTEGIYDALAFEDIDYNAIALNSTSQCGKFLELCKANAIKDIAFIIAFDNDGAGQEAAKTLADGFEKLGIHYHITHDFGGHKDPNDFLVADRSIFTKTMTALVEDVNSAIVAENEEALKEYQKNSVVQQLPAFIDGIQDSANTPVMSTGFPTLDRFLDGGLYEGLYTLGAITSLGKTSFILQIADQIAENGTTVMIFSLEMSSKELISKSISRHTYSNTFSKNNAKTAREITTREFYDHYSERDIKAIQTAVNEYIKYSNNLYIFEGVGDIGIAKIKEMVDEHIKITKKKVLVIIDYVQILSPHDIHLSDKQNMDKAVLELKRMSRDLKIPVLAISSFNRTGYAAISLSSFKESGAIEYGSDCIFGLQFKGAGAKDFSVDKAKDTNPREIELKILKNRNGQTGKSIFFNYNSRYSFFEEE